MVNHVCESPFVNVLSTSTHQKELPNTRLKRSIRNLRIFVHYDESFNSLENKDEFKTKVIEPAVKFWEDALLVKNPMSSPILLDRECDGVYRYDFINSNRIKICKDQCLSKQLCFNAVIPDKFLAKCYVNNDTEGYTSIGENGNGADNADLIIIVTHQLSFCKEHTIAYSTACHLEYTLDRPVFGLLNLCPSKINVGIHLNSAVATLKHEIVHILGFNPTLFPFFRDKDGIPLTPRDDYGNPNIGFIQLGSSSYYKYSDKVMIKKEFPVTYRTGTEQKIFHILVTPNLKKEAQRYFNCSTLDGVVLEDYGRAQHSLTHFEKKIFQNELMTASISIQSFTSRFTMAFLEDTGWYEPDYNKAEKYNFAENTGCDFVKKSCFDYIKTKAARHQSIYPYCNESLSSRKTQCSKDLKYKSYCNLYKSKKVYVPMKYRYFEDLDLISSDKFSDYCPYQLEYIQMDKKAMIHNGVCTDTNNNAIKNTKYDIFAEGFGSSSACFMFDESRKWNIKSCGRLPYPSLIQAGCYQYKCSLYYGLIIVVNGIEYQCQTDGYIIDIHSQTNYSVSRGRIVCPRCSSLCDTSVCNSYRNLLPLQCSILNGLCLNMKAIDVECLGFQIKFTFLYMYSFLLTILYLHFV